MQSTVDPGDRQAAAAEPGELLLACARFTRTASRLNRTADPSAIWRAMATLEEAGPLRVSEFAELDHCSQPTATAMIKRLETDGLAARVADPADGRAWLVNLTDSGRRRLAATRGRTARLIHDRLGEQSPVDPDELRSAIAVINRLTSSLSGPRDPRDADSRTVHEEDISA
ncbi:MarR family winged helix-turn-helix transcriptional regulator [Microlunatus soli]|uniref:MarR family protein n=1 Tax=Microlunatus soli TaxID=630515 RepID=A0A1H1X364_9ACTN|nr:MarR family transcriptional regulator [Microlunatus soli]SDT03774.1 MarR family protein [Microlunatus soli]